MQFTITITGEKSELANGLAVLKAVMGEQVGNGSVTAAIQQPQAPSYQPVPPSAPPQQEQYLSPQQHQAYQQYPATNPVPVSAPPTQQAPTSVPTTAPSYTLEQLGVAATPLMDAGRQAELIQLLHQFGVGTLTQLPKERYGEFATALRGLGARI